jgi:hypothetical protein
MKVFGPSLRVLVTRIWIQYHQAGRVPVSKLEISTHPIVIGKTCAVN